MFHISPKMGNQMERTMDVENAMGTTTIPAGFRIHRG